MFLNPSLCKKSIIMNFQNYNSNKLDNKFIADNLNGENSLKISKIQF